MEAPLGRDWASMAERVRTNPTLLAIVDGDELQEQLFCISGLPLLAEVKLIRTIHPPIARTLWSTIPVDLVEKLRAS